MATERWLAAAQRLSSVATGIYSGGEVYSGSDPHPSMEMEMQLASMAMAWWPARLASSLLRTVEMEKIRTHRTRQIIY